MRKPGIVAVAIVVVLAGIAILLMNARGTSTSSADDLSNSSGPLGPGDTDAAREGVARAARVGAVRLPAKLAEEMGQDVARVLKAYSAEQPTEMAALLGEWGLEVHPFWSEQGGQEEWAISTHLVRHAQLRPSEIVIVGADETGGPKMWPRPADGEKTGPVRYNMVAETPRGANDVVGGHRPASHTVWVHIPATLHTPGGQAASGTISLRMTRRQQDGRWLITGTALDGVPAGEPLGTPPVW